MNGKQCKSLRKALALKKPLPLDGGGLYKKEGDERWYFKQASNPGMNLYRCMKRRYIRGDTFTRSDRA